MSTQVNCFRFLPSKGPHEDMKLTNHHQQQLPPIIRARPGQAEEDTEAGQPLVPALQILEEGEGLASVLRLELEPEMPALRDMAQRDRTVDPSA
jgi:hypothetical protein